ncbi:MAG: hypothetical protein A2Z83_08155 [Omnitrophica bacterium GWA2_52_8]|nr:MAG: hypothetical protein A2Z83_08155 [Omnitrophica bacterium GWA2_52_8]
MNTANLPPYGAKPAVESHSEDHLEANLFAYWHILVKRRLVLLMALLVCLGLALIINSMQTPIYRTGAELVVEPKSSNESNTDLQLNNLMRDPTYLMTQSRLVSSKKFAKRVLETAVDTGIQIQMLEQAGRSISHERKKNFKLEDREQELLMRIFAGSITLRPVAAGARIFSLEVKGTQADLCAELANIAAEVYVEMNHAANIDAFKSRFSMTSKSLNEIREKVKASEMALEKVAAEADLLKALKVFGEKYPDVIKLQGMIRALSGKLEESQNSLQLSQIAQRQRMFSIILKPHLTAEELIPVESDLTNLKNLLEQEIETNREIYNSIYKRLQEMELAGGASLWVDIKVIEPAAIPGRPIQPNKKMNVLLSLVIGAFIGLALAFFLEYLDSSLRSLEDVRAHLRVNALGIIPEVEFETADLRELQDKFHAEGSSRVMWSTSDLKIPLYVAEAYRIIRTNFVFGAVDKSLRIFQVTSAVKGEGKTTTTVNLGISLAQVGLKVLLIDADMRRPSLHHALRLPKEGLGLQHVLKEGLPLEAVVQKTKTENLQVITSGGIPEHPAELLSAPVLTAFLNTLREVFDVVLIDSPPVISVADAPIIASRVDGTILVARSGYIPRRLSIQAKKAIEAVNGKIIGCVLNSVAASHHPYYYYRYYSDHSYGYYGSEANGAGGKKRRSPIQGERVSSLEKLKLVFQSLLPKGNARFENLPPQPRHSGSRTETETSTPTMTV